MTHNESDMMQESHRSEDGRNKDRIGSEYLLVWASRRGANRLLARARAVEYSLG